MSGTDTDDVLDFINSLPDSGRNTAVLKTKESGSNDEFLEFLDELSAHEKTSISTGNSKGKFAPKRIEGNNMRVAGKTADIKNLSVQPTSGSNTESVSDEGHEEGSRARGEGQPQYETGQNLTEENGPVSHSIEKVSNSLANDEAVDPISSISSWWSNEGSNKVSSLWGSLTSNAQQISETTFQLASNTSHQLSHQRQKFLSEHSGIADTDQILQVTNKLNSILTTMSQQIKDGLIDKEDELMNILLIYDLNNVTYLDGLCAAKFDQVMGQVEGGIKTTVSSFNHKHEQVSGSRYYDLGLFCGKAIDGEKLCFANLESSIKDYLKIADSKQLEYSEIHHSNHEVNKSNVFIAIQAMSAGNTEREMSEEEKQAPAFIEANNTNSFTFTMILKDITNNITIVSKSQPYPLRWARWVCGKHEDVDLVFGSDSEGESVDPSEWVKDWIQDGVGLTFAVLAQEYVTRRMGI